METSHGIPPVVVPSANPLTSWNTIVSGNQAKQQTKEDDKAQTSPQQQQPLQILVKENTEPTTAPQKSPIFGSQQKQSIKQKPTATVKPLKCNPSLDGFTTVQGSRSINSQPPVVASNAASTGSRVSELDDFSADLPANMPSVINNLTDYPLVAATMPVKTGSKKKKRKGKDQIEQLPEVQYSYFLCSCFYRMIFLIE